MHHLSESRRKSAFNEIAASPMNVVSWCTWLEKADCVGSPSRIQAVGQCGPSETSWSNQFRPITAGSSDRVQVVSPPGQNSTRNLTCM